MLKASNAAVWSHCGAAAKLPAVKLPPGPAAKRGREIHKLIEELARGGTPLDNPFLYIAREAYEWALTLQCVSPSWELPAKNKKLSGRIDFCGVDKAGVLHIVDFKFGKIPVEARENRQLLAYLALLNGDPRLKKCDRVKLWIYQPDAIGAEKIANCWEIPINNVSAVIAPINRAPLPNRPTPGLWCYGCTSRVYCFADRSVLYRVLTEIDTIQEPAVAVETLGAEYLFLQDCLKVFKQRLGALEDFLIYNIEKGNRDPAVVVASRAGRRAWTGAIEDIRSLGEMYGAVLTQEKPISINAPEVKALIKQGVDFSGLIELKPGSKCLKPFKEEDINDRFN